MNRFAFLWLVGFGAWAAPLAATQAAEGGPSFSERLLTLFAPRAETRAETPRYDSRMILASEIASKHAFKKPTWRCWHYVKDALLSA
ncbi:MAG: hypothetical protein WC681_24710, partial [Sterolibacterium sp.]